MQSLVWEAPRVMALRQTLAPVLAPGEVLVRVAYAGICGSELSGYLGHNALRVPPLVMGHEFAGTVAALSPEARELAPHLQLGQAVTVNPLVSCGACAYCSSGRQHLCPRRQLIGAHRPGAYAGFVAVPAGQVLPLPSAVSLATGALTEPVACGVHIAELAGDVVDEDVLVLGAGPIGLLALQALRLAGARRVFVADLNPDRLAMAADLGAEAIDPRAQDTVAALRQATVQAGVAVAVDAVGAAATRSQCIAATRSGGAVILSGLHEEASSLPVADIIRREIVVRGSFGYTPANFATALAWLAEGRVRLHPWIVEAPLDEGGAWFERLVAGEGTVAKVLLQPGT